MSHNQMIRETLSWQLDYIKKNKLVLSQLFSSAQNRASDRAFIDEYTASVEAFLSSNIVVPDKVFIGGQVSIEYESDHEIDSYTICFPALAKPEEGLISFHSPLGRQLLLKSIGEQVDIVTPGGEDRVIIRDIQFQENLKIS